VNIELPWTAHCRYSCEQFFAYNKMLATATYDGFSLSYKNNVLVNVSWGEISDIVVSPTPKKTIVSVQLNDGSSLDLVFSRRSWMGLHAPDIAVDAGNELRLIKHRL
jgi:hypothetical protein